MRKVGFVVVTGVAALGLWLGMAMRNCGYPHQYPHYPHILCYIRHTSDNADIRIIRIYCAISDICGYPHQCTSANISAWPSLVSADPRPILWPTAATRPAPKPVKVVEPWRPDRCFADHYAKVQTEPYFGTNFIFFHGHASCPLDTCIDHGLGLLYDRHHMKTQTMWEDLRKPVWFKSMDKHVLWKMKTNTCIT